MTGDRRAAARQAGGVTPDESQPAAGGEPTRAEPPGSKLPRVNALDDDDRPGDPVCLLRRVCAACGSVADEDPPTICPTCRNPITVD